MLYCFNVVTHLSFFSLNSEDPFDSLPNDDPHKPLTDPFGLFQDHNSSSQNDENPYKNGDNLLKNDGNSSQNLISDPSIPHLPPPPLGAATSSTVTSGPQGQGQNNEVKSQVATSSDLHTDLLELISFGEVEKAAEALNKDDGSMTNLLQEIDKEIERPAHKPGTEANDFLDFGADEEKSIDEIKKEQDLKFDLNRPVPGSEAKGKTKKGKTPKASATKDLLSDDVEPDDHEKDDMTLLNEILNAPSSGGDDFTREWQAVFGNSPMSANMNLTPVETDQSQSDFMPSNLLDFTAAMGQAQATAGAQLSGQMAGLAQDAGAASQQQQPQQQKSKKGQKSDMSAWFNLFADLDPLANPDAIGKRSEDITDA